MSDKFKYIKFLAKNAHKYTKPTQFQLYNVGTGKMELWEIPYLDGLPRRVRNGKGK